MSSFFMNFNIWHSFSEYWGFSTSFAQQLLVEQIFWLYKHRQIWTKQNYRFRKQIETDGLLTELKIFHLTWSTQVMSLSLGGKCCSAVDTADWAVCPLFLFVHTGRVSLNQRLRPLRILMFTEDAHFLVCVITIIAAHVLCNYQNDIFNCPHQFLKGLSVYSHLQHFLGLNHTLKMTFVFFYNFSIRFAPQFTVQGDHD